MLEMNLKQPGFTCKEHKNLKKQGIQVVIWSHLGQVSNFKRIDPGQL